VLKQRNLYIMSDLNLKIIKIAPAMSAKSVTSKLDCNTPILSEGTKTSLYGLNISPSISISKKGLNTITLICLGSCALLDALGLSIGLPILPLYVVSKFHKTEMAAGILVSMYGFGSLAGFLSFLLMKNIGFNTQKILITNLSILFFSSLLFSFSGSSFILMNIARFIQGTVYIGIWGTLTNYINSFYSIKDISSKLSIFCCYFSVGLFIGPFIGSWLYALGNDDIAYPYLLHSGLCLIVTVLALKVLPTAPNEQQFTTRDILHQILRYSDRNCLIGFAQSFFTGVATMYVQSIVSIYFQNIMHWGPRRTSYFIMVSSLSYFIGGFYAGELPIKLGTLKSMFVANICCGIGIFSTCVPIQLYVLGYLPDNEFVITLLEGIAFILFGLGVVLTPPQRMVVLSDASSRLKLHSSLTFTCAQFFVASGYMTAPLLAAKIANRWNYPFAVFLACISFSLFGFFSFGVGKKVIIK